MTPGGSLSDLLLVPHKLPLRLCFLRFPIDTCQDIPDQHISDTLRITKKFVKTNGSFAIHFFLKVRNDFGAHPRRAGHDVLMAEFTKLVHAQQPVKAHVLELLHFSAAGIDIADHQ